MASSAADPPEAVGPRGHGIEPTAFSRRLRDTAEQAVRQELGDGVVDAELAHGATLTLAVALQLGLDELEAHSQVRAVAS